MTSDPSSRRFTPEEVNAILKRAVERQGSGATASASYSDLIETARELGIDPEVIDSVMEEDESHLALADARERWIRQRRKKFFEHLRSYIIVNVMLFALDFFVSGGTWFFWVLFGWGFGILFDASDTFFPKERDIERGARKLLERESRQKRRDKGQAEGRKNLTIDSKTGRIIIEKGNKRIEIG